MLQGLARSKQIEKSLTELAKSNEDIKSIISIGSFSQGINDQFSDIDLYIFTSKIEKYITKNDNIWIDGLGNAMSRMIYKDPNSRVFKNKIIFQSGLMYDLTFIEVKRLKFFKLYFTLKRYNILSLIPKYIKYSIEGNITHFYDTIKRGYKIHKDEIALNKIIDELKLIKKSDNQLTISKEVFNKSYLTFWHCSYAIAVKLIRKDYYYTYLVYDHVIRKELIKMIEFHTLSNKKKDVYYNGRKIQEWAGHSTYNKLFKTLPKDNILSIQFALLETLQLFKIYSHKIAKENNFAINYELEEFVEYFITDIAIPECKKHP